MLKKNFELTKFFFLKILGWQGQWRGKDGDRRDGKNFGGNKFGDNREGGKK